MVIFNSTGGTEVLQVISTSVGSNIDCSSPFIPIDDTIPQQTEGVEVATATITPRYSTSKLLIQFTGCCNGSADVGATAALFQDSTSNALTAKVYYTLNTSNSGSQPFFLEHIMTSGTTSSTTFKIRIGGQDVASLPLRVYLNANTSGGQLFNGVGACYLQITEYL